MPLPNLVNRQQNQVARIRSGASQGAMTPGEALVSGALLGQAHRRIAADRADGEGLTAREWRRDQLLLNGSSRAIHRANHNDRTRP